MGKLNLEHGAFPSHNVEGGTKAYNWCFSNGIQIGVIPDWNEWHKWIIEIKINGKKNQDPFRYDRDKVIEKVYEYCDYYYKKYKKDEE